MTLSKTDIEVRIFQEATAKFHGGGLRKIIREKSSWREITKQIKEVFGDLGASMGFGVAASGYPRATEGEWLYDMIWYSMSDGMFSQLAMALESELNPGGSVFKAAEVDGDFGKLVQARADVRV